MLALIAGTGQLPVHLAQSARPAVICEMEGFPAEIDGSDAKRIVFRIETLGTLLRELRARDVTRVCMAGAVRRPPLDPSAIDQATAPLLPRIKNALERGDDGALREIIAIFEEAGLEVVGASTLVPELLPPSGVLTKTTPDRAAEAAAMSFTKVRDRMAAEDLGQSALLRGSQVLAREMDAGTDAMIRERDWSGAVLCKAPKPGQELRADMPVIGPETARAAIAARLNGIMISAGDVIVLDLENVIQILDENGLFLWVRP